MTFSHLLSPIASRWLRRVQSELDVVPVPLDAPRGATAGLRADRVLLIGNGPVIGFGVRTQALALPGQLSRRLAAATGRGAVVDVVAERGLRVEQVPDLVRAHRPSTYDAIVLSIGATDAAGLTAEDRWAERLEQTLDALRSVLASGSLLVLLPITPLQRTRGTEGRRRRLVDRHAATLDRLTRELCIRRDDVLLVQPDALAEPPRSPVAYGVLAERLSRVLTPRLDALSQDGSTATARHQRRSPDPELLRQQAVDRSGLAGSGTNAVLDRLLQHARDLYGASVAAVTLIDGDRVVYKATMGFDARAAPRATAPCNRAIRQDGLYVVPDLAGEPLAEDGWRFYVGHPLESPDGYRIGTLCVLDQAPRATDDDRITEIALVDVAERVQAELWRQIDEGRHGAPAPAPAPDPVQELSTTR